MFDISQSNRLLTCIFFLQSMDKKKKNVLVDSNHIGHDIIASCIFPFHHKTIAKANKYAIIKASPVFKLFML